MQIVIPITTEEIRELFFADAEPAESEFPNVLAKIVLMESSDDRLHSLDENLFCWSSELLGRPSSRMWHSRTRCGVVIFHGGEIYLFVFETTDSFDRGLLEIRRTFCRCPGQ